jgi:hypothetical protein
LSLGPPEVKQCLSPAGISGRALPMGEDPKPTREERLAQKLRENLRRRKAQARAIAEPDGGLPKPPEDG